MHSSSPSVSLDELLKTEPIKPRASMKTLMWLFVTLGAISFSAGMVVLPKEIFWGSFLVNVFFFTGLAAGSCVIPAIFQIVRATWSPPVRRIAEANVAYLPIALITILVTYAGREYLYPWGRAPMPGREWWMQPCFVYGRFAVLLALLFFLMWRFVRLSLRGDIGLLRDRARSQERWQYIGYDGLVKGWKGAEREVPELQRKLSWNAPLLVAVYAVVYSLFSFEMLMSMDSLWYSNMFGGWIFVGNIYMGWAVLALTAIRLNGTNAQYAKVLTSQQLWDVGKLNFGFCMLWGYMFFAQFLPQWYGNLPEETAWLMLRTREMPWMSMGWFVFGCCFVLPFVMLLSRDLKKTPLAYSVVACIICVGMWFQFYLLVLPQMSPKSIPLNIFDLGLFLGFLGMYGLSVQGFRAKYPFVGLSHPLTYGDSRW